MSRTLLAAGVDARRELGRLIVRIPRRLGAFVAVMLAFSTLIFVLATVAFALQGAPPVALAFFAGLALLGAGLFVFVVGAAHQVTVDAAGIESVNLLFGRPVRRVWFENGRIGDVDAPPRFDRYGRELEPVVRFTYEGRLVRPQIGHALPPAAAAELVRLVQAALGRGRDRAEA